ncbi:hypothetical protein UK23_42340 [Lentzea aerocolonigenes]|uniref:Uncharacterized protein n=1 Tax=Lentzea aerocolonigenes TaxID=68170 RepID=A0A0F0GFX5_LENAE|nr:hypothetical protein [Lentzea aerocolonigenes]KJK36223.1 hypothetical protein UK23_42340 [Lentzea aerocolonigenes]
MADFSQEDLDELMGDVLDGGADEESVAALPQLASLVDDPELGRQAVALAGAIMASGAARDEHLANIFLAASNRLLPEADDYYAYLLAGQLAFEGTKHWPRLAQGLDLRYYDVPCPSCGTNISLVFELAIAKASYIDDIGDTSPLQPLDADALTGIARRLYDTASAHGRERVMEAIRYMFGRATCPLCATEFTVSDQVLGS